MTEFVIDDVGREARIDTFLVAVEIVELQRFALPVVESVLTIAGVWNDDQPAAFETPQNSPPESEAVLEEVECTLQYRPHIDLVKLQ